MDELDNQQAGPETDNPQHGPEESIFDMLPDDEGAPPEADELDDGDDDQGDGQDDAPDAEAKPEEVKQPADDAEYELPDGRKVKVAEMAKSFVDFTAKTQELAQEKQQTRQQAFDAIAEVRQAQAQQFALVAQHITQLVAPGVNEQALYQLAQQDPEAYFQQKARLDAAQNFVAQITQHSQSLMQQAEQARQQAQAEVSQHQEQQKQEAAQVLQQQAWFTPDFCNKAMAYMKGTGLAPDVINAINNGQGGAAAVQLIRKAMLYDEAQKQRQTAKQPPKQSKVTPGAKPAQGLLAQSKKSQALYEAGVKGDKRAAGRWLSQNLPEA